MASLNRQLADQLFRIAELLELQGASPFRVGAYRHAAIALANLGPQVSDLIADGVDLEARLNVGSDLAGKIREAARTGGFTALKQLEATAPGDLARLSAVPGLGPRRLQRLRSELGVDSVSALRQALQQGRIATLKGFGPGAAVRLQKALGVCLPSQSDLQGKGR